MQVAWFARSVCGVPHWLLCLGEVQAVYTLSIHQSAVTQSVKSSSYEFHREGRTGNSES